MSESPSKGRQEHSRDQEESAFTPILRRILSCDEGVLAVCYVDEEGEAIDYCSVLPPFDAKVMAAELQLLSAHLAGREKRLRCGTPHTLSILATHSEFLLRRVTEDLSLVVSLRPGCMSPAIAEAVELGVYVVRRETGFDVPSWDPQATRVEVALRMSRRWDHAPAAYVSADGGTHAVEVLGRTEASFGLAFYRVRSERGEELTLVHDTEQGHWMRW